jgi:hypothetical protein
MPILMPSSRSEEATSLSDIMILGSSDPERKEEQIAETVSEKVLQLNKLSSDQVTSQNSALMYIDQVNSLADGAVNAIKEAKGIHRVDKTCIDGLVKFVMKPKGPKHSDVSISAQIGISRFMNQLEVEHHSRSREEKQWIYEDHEYETLKDFLMSIYYCLKNGQWSENEGSCLMRTLLSGSLKDPFLNAFHEYSGLMSTEDEQEMAFDPFDEGRLDISTLLDFLEKGLISNNLNAKNTYSSLVSRLKEMKSTRTKTSSNQEREKLDSSIHSVEIWLRKHKIKLISSFRKGRNLISDAESLASIGQVLDRSEIIELLLETRIGILRIPKLLKGTSKSSEIFDKALLGLIKKAKAEDITPVVSRVIKGHAVITGLFSGVFEELIEELSSHLQDSSLNKTMSEEMITLYSAPIKRLRKLYKSERKDEQAKKFKSLVIARQFLASCKQI